MAKLMSAARCISGEENQRDAGMARRWRRRISGIGK